MVTVKSPSFMTGAAILLGWFLWHGLTVTHYELEEWLVFYVVALLSWQPAAAWLAGGMRWIPAAELFFLLHLPYYVAPFVSARDEIVEAGGLLKIGLVITLFLVACRWFYRVPHGLPRRPGSGLARVLDRKIALRRGTQFAWLGLIAWLLFTVSLQQMWLPDVGSFFGTVRALITSVGSIGVFILFHELGCRRLERASITWLIAITVLAVLFTLTSGFLVGGMIQMSIAMLAFFIGRKRLPLVAMLVSAAVVVFLYAGKGDMRAEFWDEGRNYSSSRRNPVNIYLFWIEASWNRLTTKTATDEKVSSLIERGNLLQYLSLVVTETPEFRPYMGGITYEQAAIIFVPRFLWQDKPRSSVPDEALAIYYGVQTTESVNVTAIGLGRISEAWANFGWVGVFMAGAVMGLILRIPTHLSAGFSLLHFRFLLAVPFITFAMNLEASLGPAVHALSHALLFSFAWLWVVSTPAARRPLASPTKRSRFATQSEVASTTE